MVKTEEIDRVGEAKLIRRKHAKKKGSRKEIETIDILKTLGFTCTKAGGSFGSWDIVAIDDERVLLIQVKSNRWPAQVELQKLSAGAVPEFCARLIFRFDDRKPLRVATMTEKGGRVYIHEIEQNAYTQAQEAQRSARREDYLREKQRTAANNQGGCNDGRETETADSASELG